MIVPGVVVFDLGKVLLDFDYRIAESRLATRSTLEPDAVARLLHESPLLTRYEKGLLSSRQFFDEFRRGTGFRGDFAEFRAAFGDIFTPIEPMIAVHTALRQQGVPVYVFSNTNEIAAAHIRERYPFYSHFDGYILSYEHGAMKPDDRLYEIVEQETGRRGPALCYLDDRPENVEAGARRGWRAILHETPERSLSALAILNTQPIRPDAGAAASE